MTTAVQQFSPTARNAQVREFADTQRQVQDDLAKMSRADRVSQFGFSSIEDTALPVFDALGQARLLLGKQNDGTFAVKYLPGDPPPKPAGFIVSARELAIYAAWDGTFTGGYKRPADVARVDVHRSITPGFQHDGTTIVGNIPEAGGVLLSAYSQTYYVKFVAVTHGGVASAPTDEIAVLPLPASQLAVGAVGAQQLAADIAFVSRLLVGNPNAGHLEFEGRDGMVPGFRAFDGGLNPTFDLDGVTGSVTMRGTLRSADTGERLVWREYTWSNDIRAYPATGSNYANLYARTNSEGGVDYGAWLIAGPKAAAGPKQASYLWVTHNDIQLYRTRQGSGSDTGGVVFINDSGFSATARNDAGAAVSSILVSASTAGLNFGVTSVNCYANEVYAYASTTNWLDLWQDRLDLKTGASIWRIQTGGSGKPFFFSVTNNVGIQWNTTGIDIMNGSATYLAVGASSFVTQSAESTKTEIEDLPWDPERVIVDAPVSMWERRAEQRDRHGRYRKAAKYLGPMADALPAVLQVEVGGEIGIDLGRNLAVVWAASARQTARLDELERRLDALGAA